MNGRMMKRLLAVTGAALLMPFAAQAADEDLLKKIDSLSKEIADLKGQVKKVEDKSLGKWLTIGGDYRFRVDSMHGKTVAYSNAIDTMGAMVGGFLNDPSVADGTNNPSPLSYMMLGKSGVLFTPQQFGVILNNYMPQAMYNSFTGSTFLTQFNTIVMGGPTAVQSALTGTALTSQQSAILATLQSSVLPTVFAKAASASIIDPATGIQAAGATLGAQWNTVLGSLAGMGYTPAQINQLAMQMMMQGFLGSGSGKLAMTPAQKPKNETLYSNRLGLNLHAKATKDVTVNIKLDMYKEFGSQEQYANGYFADRVGVFDGTLGHVPSNSLLNVDRAYATWSNILDQPLWFSVGRRPSTNGAPSNLRMNTERPGNGGTPALLVDYAFDGMTIGYAPDVDALPGAYAKVCYGRGFDSGIKTASNSIKDTDMLGIAVIPVDTDPLRVWMQWNRGFDIFDFPTMKDTMFGDTAPSINLGSIDWYGIGAMSTFKKVGPGNINFFADLGMSVTHPSNQVSTNAGFQGLMSGEFFAQDMSPKDRTGYAVYAGIRYDLPSKTKIGFEFNHGSKYWITFAPSADDMWTSKVGTRGNVYEPYIIQELDLKPISSYLSKAFFKIGYQYYDFEYTGSNNWVGAPKKISEIKPTDLMLMAPMKEAHNVYGTFEVHF